jgi:hypothetical protein
MATQFAVLTLATGKPLYFQMAVNLARSFLWWHKNSDIRFFIATDLPDELPKDLSQVEIIRVSTEKLGQGFSAKLHLDELAPASKTLFIDADCLIVGNLESIFSRFEGRPVSVVGGSISSGEWFGDVKPICAQMGVKQLPKFNGGLYYFEQGSTSQAVYSKARELEKQYDELGLVRLRGRPNDELLMALAMALHGLEALPDDGAIMSDPQACPGELSVSVLRGHSRLVNPPVPDRRHQSWYPFCMVNPIVVHFLGDHTNGWKYQTEIRKLRLVMEQGWPVRLTEIFVSLIFSFRHLLTDKMKNLFRPLYHAIFGPRRLTRSSRI